MSITGKVDAMMGGLRRENNALRKNYERERTRTTVLESRILHAFLAAVHAELPCPFCGAETNYVSPFARHIGDCIVETIELAVASPPSASEPKYTAEKPLTLSYRELRPSDACTLCHGSGVRVAEDDPRRHVRWPNGTITTVREESLVLVATPTGSVAESDK